MSLKMKLGPVLGLGVGLWMELKMEVGEGCLGLGCN